MNWMQFVGIHFNSCIDIVKIPATAVRRRSEAAQLCGYEIKVGGMHARVEKHEHRRTKIGRRGFGGKSRERRSFYSISSLLGYRRAYKVRCISIVAIDCGSREHTVRLRVHSLLDGAALSGTWLHCEMQTLDYELVNDWETEFEE